MIVAGAGPAGAATAIGLKRAGQEVLVFEARGAIATRARNIFLRPQSREIHKELLGFDPGRDTTIMAIENGLRKVAAAEQVPVAYRTRVVDVVDHADHVTVRVQAEGSSEIRSIDARMLVDGTGGRLPATNSGELERVATGPHHTYVTAQYASPARFQMVHGVFDRATREGMMFSSVDEGRGFIAYYDLPPGAGVVDEAGVLARYDALAGKLELGTPVSPPQVFDAQQHISRVAAKGHVLKLGDSAGNADPYIGAGVTAALIDAKRAVDVLTAPGDAVQLARAAADQVLEGHRQLGHQARLMMRVRSLAFRLLPAGNFDGNLKPSDIGPSRGLELVARFLSSRSVG